MSYCSNCGKEISDDASYCLYCGVRQKNNFCRDCGKEIPNNAVFCPHCGSRQKDGTTLNSLLNHIFPIGKTNADIQGGNSQSAPNRDQDNISQADPVQHTNEEKQDTSNNDDDGVEQEEQHETAFISPLGDEIKKDIGSDKGTSSKNYIVTELGWTGQAVGVDKTLSVPDDKDTSNAQQEMSEDVVYDYHEMPLFQRFVGSVVDKIVIVLSFVLVNIAIDPYNSAGDLGIYRAMLGAVPVNYEYIDRANINGSNGISNLYNSTPYIGQTMDFDVKMTTMFVVVYLLYFFVFEIVISGSPGKRWLGGLLLSKNNEKIEQGIILLRTAIRGVSFLALIYGIHFLLGLTYYHVMIALLLLVDIPLFICHRSLIDLCSGAYYLEKGGPIVPTEEELNYEVTENSVDAENDTIHSEVETEAEEVALEDEHKNEKSRKFIFLMVAIATIGLAIAIWHYLSPVEEVVDSKQCPELVEAAKNINSKAPFLLTDGMEIVNATYVDTVFTLFCQVDGGIIPFDKIDEFKQVHKRGTLSNIQVSTGQDRENYAKFIEYHVTKVYKIKDKETGEVVTILTSPKEIEAALNEPLSGIDRLKQYIDTQKMLLPTEIDKGFVMKNIEIVDDRVVMSISVDEDIYDFRVLMEMKDELKNDMVNQLKTNPVLQKFYQLLIDTGYGLTIRYYGNQSYLDTSLPFTVEDIINIRN